MKTFEVVLAIAACIWLAAALYGCVLAWRIHRLRLELANRRRHQLARLLLCSHPEWN